MMYRWLFAFVFTGMLVACGNKGALYLPEDKLPLEKAAEQNQDTNTSKDALN